MKNAVSPDTQGAARVVDDGEAAHVLNHEEQARAARTHTQTHTHAHTHAVCTVYHSSSVTLLPWFSPFFILP